MDQKPKAICLVSGGMDSAVTLAIAMLEHDVHAMHVMYGQRTQERELQSFRDLVAYYGIANSMVISMDYMERIGASALTDKDIEVPSKEPSKGTVPVTYVPFRNAQMLSAAVAWAESTGAMKVFIGAVEEDSSGYPDCRDEFFKAFGLVVKEGTRPESKISIVTPVIQMKKTEIVKKGIELNVPFHLTWSCYQDTEKPCGVCESCVLRSRAFKEAGIADLIV